MRLLLSNKMSHVDSDLEEGEIPDDSPSLFFNAKKSKELPRRYALKNHHKHKKGCKHSIHHAKKNDSWKQRSAKGKGAYKAGQKSTYRKCHSKYNNCKVHGSISASKHSIPNSISQSLIAKKKTPFENHSICSIGPKPNWSNSGSFFSKTGNVETINDCNFSELLTKYKAMRSKTTNVLPSSNQKSHSLAKNVESLMSVGNTNFRREMVKAACKAILPESLNVKRDESDDEDELRRIALATCAKRNSEPSESSISTLGSNNSVCLPKTSEASLVHNHVSSVEIESIATDNYEIVDMDVEEDNQNTVQTVDNDLFIIDTKPSSGCQNNLSSVSEKQKTENCSDDDFEADILRAELIEQMYRQKLSGDEPASAGKQQESLHKIEESTPQSDKQILKENFIKMSESPKPNFKRPIPEMEAKKSPKRLIINLNGESSSEESEQEDGNPVNDNPVASIEALISGIRQKSDSSEKNNEHANIVPEAVSCLSRAQQEEYNTLMKILAEKKKNIPEKAEVKNKVVHSPMDDLKVLEEKLIGVQEPLARKKIIMTNLSKEVNAKRSVYMKSKLAAQHLKEQYVFAEKQRRIHLNAWSKSCKNFESVKKSVSDMENKIVHLQDLCSKVGSSIQGKNYSLPSISKADEQK